jgi:hypothetical protein
VRLSGGAGPALQDEALIAELEAMRQDLQAGGMDPAVLQALQRSQLAVRTSGAIPYEEIPSPHVCRYCGELFLGDPPAECAVCQADGVTLRAFLPTFYLEPLEPAQALAFLESGAAEVDALAAGLSEQQMVEEVQPGEWNMRAALLHLLVTQELLAGRLERMLREENPSLAGVAAWEMDDTATLSAAEILQRYHRSRTATLALLHGASYPEWQRTAWHQEFGRVSVLQQASYFAKHERSHFAQMKTIRRLLLGEA